MQLRRLLTLALFFALGLSACDAPTDAPPPATAVPTRASSAATATTSAPTRTTAASATPPPTATTLPTDTPEPTAAPSATPDVLPRDAVRIEFEAADGTTLVGYYFPAALANAPLVVLMEMVGDDQQRWVTVGLVSWLQNRGLPGTAQEFVGLFPAMPEGRSYAVFTFDFRQHGESANGPVPDFGVFLDDARAAIEVARSQPDVDPDRVGLVGSSIGGDAAVDTCADGCVAALSLSPGSYLNMVYSTTVEALDQAGIPAWCLAATGDREADPTCASASGDHYRHVPFEGNDHGTDLIRIGQTPDIGPIFLEWLDTWSAP
ncbi:MAG: hypothetical protein IT317_02040 [Anaerolineales bacterium]|nr:hypothetical protein [Anaerolineales bacterium]